MKQKKKTLTIKFPAPLPAEIPCPICEGNKCKVCEKTGKIKIKVDARVPVEKGLIIKYVVDNLQSVANYISKNYGLNPQISTQEVLDIDSMMYEIVQISSIGGVCWVVNRIDELEPPRYFQTYQELVKFKGGLSE